MGKNFVVLTEKIISGIKSPLLVFRGYIFKDKFDVLLLIDGEKFDYNFEYNRYNKFFSIITPIPFNSKKIELYVVADKNKYLVLVLKNTLLRRLFGRIKVIAKKFLKKLCNILSVFGRAIVFAWKRYHFIIPIQYWPKYYKRLIKKLSGEYSDFYDPFNKLEYEAWYNESFVVDGYKKMKYEPLISFVIPVYNIGKEYLSECLDSILAQNYPNFEICIADDHSTNEETLETLREYEKKDRRIKVVYRKENGHISKATNSAIEIANGEYIALMDDDDVIVPDALLQFVKVLNKYPEMDLIYSDEDKMDLDGGLCDPHFKPDYSPDTLFGGNYICHFSIYRKSIIDKIGGFRSEFVGAQDFDLVLRFVEQTNNIYHVPKILYHWRKVPGSTAVTIDNKEYAIENGKKAIEEALKRRGLKGKVIVPIKSAHYIVEYDVLNSPMVSIIIPTKDSSKLLDNCLKSIFDKSTYKNFEVIVVNNGSVKDATFSLFKKYQDKYKNFRVIDADYEFNYSKLNNDAVKVAKGEYVLLLNNDTEVITKNWIELMLGYAMQEHIGAVGVKLLYSDYSVQHGGIVLGVAKVAANVYGGVDSDSYGAFGRLLIPFDYSAVTAACLMIKKSKYLEINGFDEKLKVAYNDVDFNIKLLEKGYYNVFLPMVNLFHFESKSRGMDITDAKVIRLNEEAEYMVNKWGKLLNNDRFYNKNYSLNWWFLLDRRR